jgi:hypothetical protein
MAGKGGTVTDRKLLFARPPVLSAARVSLRVVHPITLLAEAYRDEDYSAGPKAS